MAANGRYLFLFFSILFFSPSLFAQTNDPCNEVTGHWKGTWNATYIGCTWKLEATGSLYEDTITLQMHRSHGKPWHKCVREDSFAMSGVCKNGHISFNTNLGIIQGPIQGGTIGLYGDNRGINITLTKG